LGSAATTSDNFLVSAGTTVGVQFSIPLASAQGGAGTRAEGPGGSQGRRGVARKGAAGPRRAQAARGRA
jgi:hypothetical protein